MRELTGIFKEGTFFLVLLVLLVAVEAGAAEPMEFRCPRAFQGIKSDMLPTYWQPIGRGEELGADQSHVQGQFMICIYRKPADKHIGNVRRLIPKGYKCETDGRGIFECMQAR